MNNKIKSIVVTVCFAAISLGLMAANIITPDAELSYSERRRLMSVPSYSFDKLASGELFGELERYFLDQFVYRDKFRGLKAFTALKLLRQSDNNDIYIIDGSICKLEYPLSEKSIANAAKKLNEVYDKYLAGMNVSYAVIPDKNYFVASKNGYLSIDYQKLLMIMSENIEHMNYIDLFGSLTIEDYYSTDIHWDQADIIDIADRLLKEMGNEASASDAGYRAEELYPFYGSYYGQAALGIEPDKMVYLTNDAIESAVVYDHIDRVYSRVYEIDKFGGVDPYDVFLSGAKSIITISNPACGTDRELILFRDSFGSSLAPLMLSGYSKITLVDLRYLSTDLLGDYIDFSKDQDVLFLYNIAILNNSAMLK